MGGTAVRGARRPPGRDDDFAGAYPSTLHGLVGYFRAKGLSAEDARDLAHETVLRTLVHLKRHGRTRSDLGPLTKTIARNLLVERIRRATPAMVPLSEATEVVDDAPEPADHALAAERREAIRNALGALTPRHRRVVELWMQGRTPAEIAQELGIKRNAADAILHRARRSLAARLGPRALWGAVVLAWLRARSSFREGAQALAPYSPASAAVAPAGISLVAAGLAAMLSFGTPSPSDATPKQMNVSSADVAPAPSGERAAVERSAVGDIVAPSATVAAPIERAEKELAIGVGATDEEEDAPVTVGVTLRPDEDGERGKIGPMIEGLMTDACGGIKSACKGRR